MNPELRLFHMYHGEGYGIYDKSGDGSCRPHAILTPVVCANYQEFLEQFSDEAGFNDDLRDTILCLDVGASCNFPRIYERACIVRII